MSLPTGNPRIPEGINTRNEHPLREFLILAAGVSASLIAVVFMLSFAVRFFAPYIPFAWELHAAPSLQASIEEEATHSPDAIEALQSLGQALLSSSLDIAVDGQLPASIVPPANFHFALITLPLPNAFATLGAQVAVTDGLLQHVQSENGLAMVVAHEIAHVQLRHPIEAASRGLVVQIALAAILGASEGGLLSGSLSTGGILTLLSFNRDMELQADRRALAILKSHYGHLGGADEFFRSMAASPTSTDWLEFTQTHPNSGRRLKLIGEAQAADDTALPLQPLAAALQP